MGRRRKGKKREMKRENKRGKVGKREEGDGEVGVEGGVRVRVRVGVGMGVGVEVRVVLEGEEWVKGGVSVVRGWGRVRLVRVRERVRVRNE